MLVLESQVGAVPVLHPHNGCTYVYICYSTSWQWSALNLWSSHGSTTRLFYFHIATLGKLFTHMCLCHQAVYFGTDQRAVMLCDWVGNRRSGVALAMCHRLRGITTWGSMAYDRETSTAPTLQWSTASATRLTKGSNTVHQTPATYRTMRSLYETIDAEARFCWAGTAATMWRNPLLTDKRDSTISSCSI